MITDRYQNHVTLDWHLMLSKHLIVQRTPTFLRFVYREVTNNAMTWEWDALDQIEDTPKPDEQIAVGVLDTSQRVHVDRVDPQTRRRVGEWLRLIVYKPHPSPPPDDVLRDNEKWRAWCMEQPEAKGRSDG